MEIKRIDPNILAARASSVFLSEKWLAIYESGVETYGIFDKGGRLTGGFVLFRQKLFGVSYYRNPMFMSTINLFIENKARNKAKLLTENKKLIKAVSDFFDKLPYSILSVYFPEQFIDMQHFFWKGYKVVPNYTYQIDLSQTMEQIRTAYATERRNDLKKAEKDGIEVRRSRDLSEVSAMVRHTFNRKEKDFDSGLVDKILQRFADEQNSFAFVAYKDNQALAAAFCIFDQEKVYYVLGGYDNGNKHQGAGALAVDAAIAHSKTLGIKTFDFEGSMLPEVERYFRGFGGDLVPYYSVNKAKFPFNFILKMIKPAQF
jgi:lipid II:glycine glycyltransferase (peptidoglycan interpeptide bridge formation enzyme)